MFVSSVLDAGVKVPVQVMLSLVDIVPRVPSAAAVEILSVEKEVTASEKTSDTVGVSPIFRTVSLSVKVLTEGAVVSITNELILNMALLPELLVTVIVQSEYVPSLRVLKVIVLLPEIAELVLEEQEPPYVIVPASTDENV